MTVHDTQRTRPSSGLSVTVERRVEFSDTDATGHHHYLCVLRWLEDAERVLHEQLGVADTTLGKLPRVHIEIDFSAAVYYRDLVEVTLTVAAVGRTSLTHEFDVRCGPLSVASGRYVVVLSAGNAGVATPWPPDVRALLCGDAVLPGERYARLEPDMDAALRA